MSFTYLLKLLLMALLYVQLVIYIALPLVLIIVQNLLRILQVCVVELVFQGQQTHLTHFIYQCQSLQFF